LGFSPVLHPYLSAFLNAGRTVDYRLRHEHGAAYKPWRDIWKKSHLQEDKVIKFFHDKRSEEVHEKDSSHNAQDVNTPVRVPLRGGIVQNDAHFGVVPPSKNITLQLPVPTPE
jgi:hypothetical protein